MTVSFLNSYSGPVLWSFIDWDLGTRVDEKKERKRESGISQVMWKTSKAHAQDLCHSRRHRAFSQGGLESPVEKVSSVGFDAPKRIKTERRTWGTQVSSRTRVLH